MFLAAVSVILILVILLLAEYGSRAKGIHSELTRKFIHMSVGTFVAFWPFFLGWGKVQLLSVAFFVVIMLSLKFNIFRSIHAVSRGGFGEVMFAMVIGILAVICTEPWIFAVAMLHLSLGDGLAAVVGTLWGDKHEYKIFGSIRSYAGTATFLIVSIAIMSLYVIFGDGEASVMMLAGLPLLATFTENISIHGTDNLFVPIVVALGLMSSV
jgi:phytol kinase